MRNQVYRVVLLQSVNLLFVILVCQPCRGGIVICGWFIQQLDVPGGVDFLPAASYCVMCSSD
jgi:hypothetical protein